MVDWLLPSAEPPFHAILKASTMANAKVTVNRVLTVFLSFVLVVDSPSLVVDSFSPYGGYNFSIYLKMANIRSSLSASMTSK